jgi:predicted  nucleic acid-binding Zn-ribbon protein
MIIHCPKCGYSRKPSDVAPATECPECGIIFEKFLAAPPRKPVVRSKTVESSISTKPVKKLEPPAQNAEAFITTCPACGGTVAYGAKICPHCGKEKPAPKPTAKVTKTHLVLALLLLIAVIASQTNQRPAMTAEEVTRICAKEAGLDVNSSRPVTMQDIGTIDACVNRHGFKTKP